MWDERYSQDEYVFGTAPAAFLSAHSDLITPGLSTLVVADGEGRNSVYLAELGADVTAMDASPIGLAKAAALAEQRGVHVTFQQADLLSWSWEPDAYDLVVGIFIQFMGPAARTGVFEGMQRTVRPGGRVLLHGYTPKQLEFGTGGPPIAENMYTNDLLVEEFGDLAIERLVSYEAEIQEGTGHVGRSALIDLIARKSA